MTNMVRVSPYEKGAFHSPAVGVQATISSAAPGAKTVQVLRSFSATLVAGAVAEKQDVVIRDGPTGTGTILKRIPLNAPAGKTDRVSQVGMNLSMTPGNVCTVEFVAAPTGTGFECVEINTLRTDQVADSSLYGTL